MSDPRRLFSIGEFSRVTGITVKALRFYHDEGLLAPTFVDAQSGYRYYDPGLVERARVIVYLRSLEFPLDQVREIPQQAGDDEQLLAAMDRHKSQIEARIRQLCGVVKSLNEFIIEQREAKAMSNDNYEVQEQDVDRMLIAGVRMKGRYSDSSRGFSKIGRSFGRIIAGPCFMVALRHGVQGRRRRL
jgi:DNA-binding transcriptional MerR regulator